MELASDTKQVKYSPTSTPILDGLRPVSRPRGLRVNTGEYFFLSGAVILALMGLPLFRGAAEAMAQRDAWSPVLVPYLLLPAAALTVSLAAHEAGHLLAAWLCGFTASKRVSADRLAGGENDWSLDVLRVATRSLESRDQSGLRKRLLLLFGAGPAANFLLPVVLESLAWAAGWGPVTELVVHLTTGFCVLQGIADLLPDSGRGGYSDGSRILMLLKNDAAAQRWFSIIVLQMVIRRGEHPSSWNEATVLSINIMTDETRDAVAARWLGYVWATSRQDITSATRYLENALELQQVAHRRLSDRLFFEAALFQAWFRDDAEKARFWVLQMRNSSAIALQQPRLSIALMWAEGRLFDAWEKLRDYLAEIQKLPTSPARSLAERQAHEWKAQMESRMLTRAWRTIYSMSQEIENAIQPAPATRN
jgi:hypothetical protein